MVLVNPLAGSYCIPLINHWIENWEPTDSIGLCRSDALVPVEPLVKVKQSTIDCPVDAVHMKYLQILQDMGLAYWGRISDGNVQSLSF